jgi:hypothetical protein
MVMMFARSLGWLIAARTELTPKVRVDMADMHLG